MNMPYHRATGDASTVARPSRLHLTRGQALVWGPLAQLLWLACCLGAYVPVMREFAYSGFVVVTRPDVTQLVFAAVALLGLSFLLPRRLTSPADYVVVGLFSISVAPFYAYWFLAGQPWWQGFLVTGYWCTVLLIDRFPFRSGIVRLKGTEQALFVVARGLVALGCVLILSEGQLTLKLSLADVYTARAAWASQIPHVSGYVFSWLAYAVLPILFAHAWRNRRFSEFVVLGFFAYMLFTSTGQKSFLFMPMLVMAVVFLGAWHPGTSIVPMGLGVFVIAMVVLGSVTGSIMWVSLGIRRTLFVPAHLTSAYLKFFNVNPVIRLSDSILGRGWSVYPYPVPVPNMVGAAIGDPGVYANDGLLADGFANFGLVGCFVWAVLLGILIKFLRVATERREHLPEAWAVVASWPVVLLGSGLTTSLLTHGLALGLVMVWALSAPGSGEHGSEEADSISCSVNSDRAP